MREVAQWIEKDTSTLNSLYGKSEYPANHHTKWCPSDTEELFERNMRDSDSADKLLDLGWTRDSIIYRFNNHGFRTPHDWEIGEQAPGNMFLGCSVTMGIGLNIEDTWSYMIASQLGGKFYNLAQAGTGLETQYRMIKAWAPLLKPKRIFTIGAFEPRREFLDDNGNKFMFTPMTTDGADIAPFIFSEKETMISSIRVMDAIKQVAAECGAELWYPGIENLNLTWKRAPNHGKCARDLIHAGKGYHESIARTLENWKRLA